MENGLFLICIPGNFQTPGMVEIGEECEEMLDIKARFTVGIIVAERLCAVRAHRQDQVVRNTLDLLEIGIPAGLIFVFVSEFSERFAAAGFCGEKGHMKTFAIEPLYGIFERFSGFCVVSAHASGEDENARGAWMFGILDDFSPFFSIGACVTPGISCAFEV